MAITYKKEDSLESLFESFAKLPDKVDSDPNAGKKKEDADQKADK
ncbi:SPJ_0845 family protein [Streptococcus loxodontisalivarius]|uniref:ABC transporter ATP-binding protein n=1 Tax=Streptococcus loxodontisalivarius TaxID=1349415 RepID=A0ABS2PSK5_9STRE|nr:SPJ_0845 family protein [Streptococcus loxodontisalivarius]MBM7643019.1 hypothetical protein [Streptococcus loxodontisalivarius]